MSSLCKVEFLCDDRKVGQVLRALAGLIHGAPNVVPVVNAQPQANGSVAPKSSGKAIDMFAHWLGDKHQQELTSGEVQTFCTGHGLAASSYSYVIDEAVKAGLVKKRKVPGFKNKLKYEVVRT